MDSLVQTDLVAEAEAANTPQTQMAATAVPESL